MTGPVHFSTRNVVKAPVMTFWRLSAACCAEILLLKLMLQAGNPDQPRCQPKVNEPKWVMEEGYEEYHYGLILQKLWVATSLKGTMIR